MLPSPTDVAALCGKTAFGAPIIVNHLRGLVAEAIVRLALPEDWTWCSTDWAAWDFQHQDDTRVEVRQASLKQSWAPGPRGYGKPSFDIAIRQGRYEGTTWIAANGRFAQLYVFALHAVVDEAADQRDPAQWRFIVVPAADLPSTKTIGLARLERLGTFIRFDELAATVDAARLKLRVALSADVPAPSLPETQAR